MRISTITIIEADKYDVHRELKEKYDLKKRRRCSEEKVSFSDVLTKAKQKMSLKTS